jgi:hypothetical protein
MDIYAQIVEKIIRQQESIIGPVALEQALRVKGLHVDWKNHQVSIDGDGPKIIDELVETYKALFGQISVEVSKEAADHLLSQLPPTQLPNSLK